MIDSVLKGTGNSRFLKSAVPSGTSWADALAMLQAGTFPIDFNGINTEGFQQVGTPLNKANLLKDATAAQIGLPPSTTPDGMFQALGNTGELHVWRKMVKTSSDTPAGYTLGAVQSNLHIPTAGQTVDFVYSASITVGNDGTVSQPSSSTKSVFATNTYVSVVQSLLAGKFFTAKSSSGAGIDGVWYCPSGLTVSVSGNDIILSQAQKVNSHGIIPAGTTTTYPVSTNPNAYQEGDDAKEAGYVVGEVETGKFKMSATPTGNTFYVNSAIEVTDDGTITFPEGYHFINIGQNSSGPISARDVLGNFMSLYQNKYGGDFEVGDVWFIPSDATITDYVYVTKRQRVTGYAAIPAGTTIEYLGKLGDKARVQVVSYVGTGVSGSANPTTVTFDFVPKIVIAHCKNNEQYRFIAPYGIEYTLVRNSLNDHALTITWKNKTMSYQNNSPGLQMNSSGVTYIVVAIG